MAKRQARRFRLGRPVTERLAHHGHFGLGSVRVRTEPPGAAGPRRKHGAIGPWRQYRAGGEPGSKFIARLLHAGLLKEPGHDALSSVRPFSFLASMTRPRSFVISTAIRTKEPRLARGGPGRGLARPSDSDDDSGRPGRMRAVGCGLAGPRAGGLLSRARGTLALRCGPAGPGMVGCELSSCTCCISSGNCT
jgi:hypothetical protein